MVQLIATLLVKVLGLASRCFIDEHIYLFMRFDYLGGTRYTLGNIAGGGFTINNFGRCHVFCF